MDHDFDLGNDLKDDIVPLALEYYLGVIEKEEELSEEEDEEESDEIPEKSKKKSKKKKAEDGDADAEN